MGVDKRGQGGRGPHAEGPEIPPSDHRCGKVFPKGNGEPAVRKGSACPHHDLARENQQWPNAQRNCDAPRESAEALRALSLSVNPKPPSPTSSLPLEVAQAVKPTGGGKKAPEALPTLKSMRLG